MNYARTAILLAGLTGLFMAVGYLIGGRSADANYPKVGPGASSFPTGTPKPIRQ